MFKVYILHCLTFCSSGEPRPLSSADTLAATNYYVDSVNGSDSNQPNYTYQTGVSRRTGIYIDEYTSHIVIDGSKWRGIVIYGHYSGGITLHKEECVDDAPVPSDITTRNVEIFDNGSASESNGLWYPDGVGVDLAGGNVVFERVIIHDNGQDEFQSAGGIRGVTLKCSR